MVVDLIWKLHRVIMGREIWTSDKGGGGGGVDGVVS